MKLSNELCANLLIVGVALSAVGCSSSRGMFPAPHVTGSPAAGVDAQAATNATATSAVMSGDSGLAFVTDVPDPSPASRSHIVFNGADAPYEAPVSHDPKSHLVGLYGEFAGAVRPTAQPDGSGNLRQITSTSEGACFDPDTNRDGTLLVFASTQHRTTADLYLKSSTGRTMTQITTDPADDVMPAFAPDGRQIAFASNREGNWNIYVTTVDGSPAMELTNDSAHELHPTWSPDGQRIAYCKLGNQSGRWEIWVLDLSNRVHQFLEYGLFPRWNPDPARSQIAFQRARERGSRLFSVWTIDYIDGEAMHPTEIVSAANAAAMHPAWSPDGNRLVFVTVLDPDREPNVEPTQSDVWVIGADGTSRTNLTNGRFRNLYPVWASDGAVYFLSDRSGLDNIWSVATARTIDLDAPAVPANVATAEPSDERP